MFLDPQTSLIPTVLALSSFFINNIPHLSWYPNWYLGTPYHYLIGPIVPLILFLVTKIFVFPLYYVYIGTIIAGILISAYGTCMLLYEWGLKKRIAIVSALLYIVMPSSWLLLYYQNGLKHIAFAFIPFILIVYRRFLLNGKKKYLFSLIVLISISLLITINVLLTIIIGLAGVVISWDADIISSINDRFDKNKLHRKTLINSTTKLFIREEVIIKTFLIVLLSLCLVTIWYTPSFWYVLLANPSFGGLPLWNVVVRIIQSLLQTLPFIFALLFLKWRKYKLKKSVLFSILFLVSFVVLSIVRFLANPAFVIDWINFFLELQFSLSLVFGTTYDSLIKKSKRILIILCMLIVIFTGISTVLLKGIIIYSESEYQKEIIDIFQKHKMEKNERIFLSGSPVFWINSYLPIIQVRGGNDMVAVNPVWAEGAYQIREGEDSSLTTNWLQILGVKYILINNEKSKEPFHDFKHLEKYGEMQLLDDKNGNKLYQVTNTSLARIANSDLLTVPKPNNGADYHALSMYATRLIKPANLAMTSPEEVQINGDVESQQIISLAITYDSDWKIVEGNGILAADSFGNIRITPDKPGNQKFILEHKISQTSYILTVFFAGIILSILMKYRTISSLVKPRLPKISLGLGDEDEY